MTLWPSDYGVGLLSRWGLPAWVRIPQVSFGSLAVPLYLRILIVFMTSGLAELLMSSSRIKRYALENIFLFYMGRECYCFFMVRAKRVLLSSETDEQQSGAL